MTHFPPLTVCNVRLFVTSEMVMVVSRPSSGLGRRTNPTCEIT